MTTPATGRTRARVDPQRRRLGLAVLMVVVGSFLPWIDTAIGAVSGARGPGLWTFYAAMLGLAGMLVPRRRIAGVQAAIMSVVCVVLPAWQLFRALDLLGTQGWVPGPGVVLVFGGGVLAAAVARGMLTTEPATP
jgi:hypothetical protein